MTNYKADLNQRYWEYQKSKKGVKLENFMNRLNVLIRIVKY